MTDIEVLHTVINELGAISVPAALTEQVAIPIHNARQKLIVLNNAIVEKRNEEEKPEKTGEPEIVIEEE